MGEVNEARVTFDPERLAAARQLRVEPAAHGGPRDYRVTERKVGYEVTSWVGMNEETACHCEDMLRSKKPPVACKHMIACLLYERGELE